MKYYVPDLKSQRPTHHRKRAGDPTLCDVLDLGTRGVDSPTYVRQALMHAGDASQKLTVSIYPANSNR